jgi:hypothetical protein
MRNRKDAILKAPSGKADEKKEIQAVSAYVPL